MTPDEVRGLLDRDRIVLVDVREGPEWESGRILGAIHAPLSRLAELAPNLPAEKPVVFYCLAGGRSAQAVALVRSLGLNHDTHMAGGINAWRAEGYPVSS